MEDKKETGPSETVPASSGENPQTTTTTTTVGNMSSPLTRSPPAITPPHPFDSGAKSPTSAPARATVISPLLKSPDSGSKSKPSVKHLECYYFFDDPQGCKWTEERCLYAHHTTGHRAAPPIQIEPGRKSRAQLIPPFCHFLGRQSSVCWIAHSLWGLGNTWEGVRCGS